MDLGLIIFFSATGGPSGGQNKSGDEFGFMHKTSMHFRYLFLKTFFGKKRFFLEKGFQNYTSDPSAKGAKMEP